MIPSTVIIALLCTLLLLGKDYLKLDRKYNILFIVLFLGSWVSALFDNIIITYISYSIVSTILLLILISDLFFNKEKISANMNEQFMDVYKGYHGVIRYVYDDGRYLGTILLNGQLAEIILYSDDSLSENDDFEILGLKGSKFYCKKLLTKEE